MCPYEEIKLEANDSISGKKGGKCLSYSFHVSATDVDGFRLAGKAKNVHWWLPEVDDEVLSMSNVWVGPDGRHPEAPKFNFSEVSGLDAE